MFDFTLTLWTQLHQTPFCLRFWEHSRVGKKNKTAALIFLYSRGFGKETVSFASFVMVTASNRQVVKHL